MKQTLLIGLVCAAACAREGMETSPATVNDVTAIASIMGCAPLATLEAVDMTTKTVGADNGGYWNLYADGYLGEVIADLQSGQSGSRDDISKDALALLTDILDDRRTRASLGGTL